MNMKTGIDTHCHLEYMKNMEEVAEEVRKRMLAAVCSVPNPKDFNKILELRKRFSDCIFVCLGFHPEIADDYTSKDIEESMEFIKSKRKEIVGIGEIGLDYAWIKDRSKQEKTKEVFIQFIDLAKELHLPIVIHIRNNPETKNPDAFDDTLKILTDQNASAVVMHCFSGNENNLKYALEQNYWISYATIIARSDKHKRLAGKTPLESMLLETDSPWLDPDTKDLVNRPWKIERSAEIIANIKEKTNEEIMRITTENAIKCFDLKFL
jgi:TatD DNase family protein